MVSLHLLLRAVATFTQGTPVIPPVPPVAIHVSPVLTAVPAVTAQAEVALELARAQLSQLRSPVTLAHLSDARAYVELAREHLGALRAGHAPPGELECGRPG